MRALRPVPISLTVMHEPRLTAEHEPADGTGRPVNRAREISQLGTAALARRGRSSVPERVWNRGHAALSKPRKVTAGPRTG